jgi:hypothetical protein
MGTAATCWRPCGRKGKEAVDYRITSAGRNIWGRLEACGIEHTQVVNQ